MHFALSPEQQAVQKLAREFAQGQIAPGAAARDKTGEFPSAIFRQLGELGLLGLPFSEEVGGAGGDTISYALAVEEIARCCAATALSYAAHISLGCAPFYLFGAKEQQQKWLPPLCRGDFLGAFGLTEPNAGSDAGGTQTKARLEDGQWVINGSKCWITNADHAGCVVATAVTDKGGVYGSISSIIIPTGTPGYTVRSRYQKLGMRASNTCELFFDDVKVPEANLLGQRGLGFKQFLKVLDGGRIAIGALAVGIAQASLEAALKYARERTQFGQPIAKFQAIAFKLADMATHVEVARTMVLKAAWLKDNGRPFTKEAAMAKLFASEIATKAALEAVQIHGGYGYVDEFPVERYLRDAKLCEIGEGTSEVLRLVIARQLGCFQ
ncbi:acyl-CoA dehydrogenase [Heliobacterium gestii]|uniref:Acyl-CoA dehydrogenase n=1 Tax=Heliomicrobium gestii TaxID=2699 RepID=A0A845LL26_HELGE|nr:acyl-CoA dehydrogenase family protein [Heliomicrobium gestii]MBM7867700.1 alkylation response protein AidB-like acyl-CoA dehydrogenase [Heliomicrobium gestii]MZP44093.1 acyl-CoA dehydrogenase [Heliomicrobium gestii]